MTRSAFDCVVVGAGIVGAACAARLAKAGMSVALVDAFDAPGLGATAAGMGHIVVMDDSEEQLLLTQYSQRLWHKLSRSLPVSAEHQLCGTLWVAGDNDEMDEVARKHTLYRAHGIESEILGSEGLHALEPNLCENLVGALLVKSDSVVYAPAVARFLAQDSIERGAESVQGHVRHIGEGIVTFDDGRLLRARLIVNAAGEHSPELTAGIPVKKRMGHLAITDRYPDFLRHQIVELGYLKSAHSIAEDSVAFNVQPRVTGQVLIGSSRQFGVSAEVDHAILGKMLSRAVTFMPKLADVFVLRVWTGYRAATPDKLPLIGPWPDDPTLFLATGHEGLGITTSLATAELLFASIQGSESAIPIDPYLPARFSRIPAHA